MESTIAALKATAFEHAQNFVKGWNEFIRVLDSPNSSTRKIHTKIAIASQAINNLLATLEEVERITHDSELTVPYRKIQNIVDNELEAWEQELADLDAAEAYSAYAFRSNASTIWGPEPSDDPDWAFVSSEENPAKGDDLESEAGSALSDIFDN